MFLTRITLMKIQKWKVAYNNYRLSKFEKLVKNQKINWISSRKVPYFVFFFWGGGGGLWLRKINNEIKGKEQPQYRVGDIFFFSLVLIYGNGISL